MLNKEALHHEEMKKRPVPDTVAAPLLPRLLVLLAGCGTEGDDADRSTPTERSNIILIMSDDMGIRISVRTDVRFGRRIWTASPDSGLRFLQFYNTAHYVPSRASLMTGRADEHHT